MAKASLYNTFGSKDELVRAYLQTRQASVAQRITQAVDRYDTPRERLLAVFEGQGELFAQPDYRGCAFARASAESHPGDLAEQAAEAYRRWVRALLTELAAQAGVRVRARAAGRPGRRPDPPRRCGRVLSRRRHDRDRPGLRRHRRSRVRPRRPPPSSSWPDTPPSP